MNELHLQSGWIMVIISSCSFVLSGLAAVLRVGYLLAQHEKNTEDKFTGKINRVYQRFDEYKNLVEGTFVRKDMCSVLHNGTAIAVTALKEDMKSEIAELKIQLADILKEIRNGRKV